jgi:hypothetical protein
MKPSYKEALADEILRHKNNPYTKSELLKIRTTKVQDIHDELVLRGSVKKMDSQEFQLYLEMQWD